MLVSYHTMGAIAHEDFPDAIEFIFPRSRTTCLSVQGPSAHENHHGPHERVLFVNNAKILSKTKKYEANFATEQLLHIIDEVLEPQKAESSVPPTALELLRNFEAYPDVGIDLSLVKTFANKIDGPELEELFSKVGFHTYFVPLQIPTPKIREVTKAVVRGHVVPQNPLFLRTMGKKNYRTALWNEEDEVAISINPEQVSVNANDVYVQSSTFKSKIYQKKSRYE